MYLPHWALSETCDYTSNWPSVHQFIHLFTQKKHFGVNDMPIININFAFLPVPKLLFSESTSIHYSATVSYCMFTIFQCKKNDSVFSWHLFLLLKNVNLAISFLCWNYLITKVVHVLILHLVTKTTRNIGDEKNIGEEKKSLTIPIPLNLLATPSRRMYAPNFI